MNAVTRQPLAVIVIVLMWSAVGCDRGSSANDSASKAVTGTETAHVDNCSLVTDAEASSLAGHELKHDEDGPLGCPYVRPGSSTGEFIVRAFEGKGAARENFGEHSTDTTVLEISGVGESAAVLARDQHVNFLIVRKGSRYIQFVTTFLENVNLGSPQLRQAEDLAVKAIGRMK